MREIKFRAWDKEKNEYIYFTKDDIMEGYGIGYGLDISIPHTDWEQFTGLHDRNGKEIYFNDFVRAPSENIFQMIWYDEEMRIALKYKDTIYNFNVDLYEVINYIHEEEI